MCVFVCVRVGMGKRAVIRTDPLWSPVTFLLLILCLMINMGVHLIDMLLRICRVSCILMNIGNCLLEERQASSI